MTPRWRPTSADADPKDRRSAQGSLRVGALAPRQHWEQPVAGVELSALGEEAFVPSPTTRQFAVFALEEWMLGDLKLSLGGRIGHSKIGSEGDAPGQMQFGPSQSRSFTPFSATTTHQYTEANLAMKEKALARMQDPDTASRRFCASDSLPEFLKGLRSWEVHECHGPPDCKMFRALAFRGPAMTEVFSSRPKP
jgi:hypothetical protein